MDVPNFNILSTANTSFESLRSSGCIYVDKTDLIYDLIAFTRVQKDPIFFSRPRRFGKSLICSIFESWFRHGRTYFKGLKLDDLAQEEDRNYVILKMSFANCSDPKRDLVQALYLELKSALETNAEFINKIDEKALSGTDVYFLLKEILNKTDDDSLVMIIDEYDAPLIARLGNQDEYERATQIYTNFFNYVKDSFSDKFRFLFLTGVARFSHTSIFSGFNILDDYSYDPMYAGLFGFTKEELLTYYRPYLEYFAKNKGLAFEELIESFTSLYDGYCFDPTGKIKVFNPWSLLKSFRTLRTFPSLGFFPYWMRSGDFSTLADKYLSFHFKDQDVQKALHEICQLMMPLPVNYEELQTDLDYFNQEPKILLLQTGYLTLRAIDDELFLVIPNEEVRSSLAKNLLGRYPNLLTSKFSSSVLSQAARSLSEALRNHDAEAIRERFNEILCFVGVESCKVVFGHETVVRDFIFSNVVVMGLLAIKEVEGTLGYADLIISFKNQKGDTESAVFEFKRLSANEAHAGQKKNLEQASTLARKASEQIAAKRYYRAAGIGVPVSAYAVVIDSSAFEISVVEAVNIDASA